VTNASSPALCPGVLNSLQTSNMTDAVGSATSVLHNVSTYYGDAYLDGVVGYVSMGNISVASTQATFTARVADAPDAVTRAVYSVTQNGKAVAEVRVKNGAYTLVMF